ncbi:MAG: hypothetical protein AVDCRST_MAG10-12, partial [uncultured Acidimicrobiales bacterium]
EEGGRVGVRGAGRRDGDAREVDPTVRKRRAAAIQVRRAGRSRRPPAGAGHLRRVHR